MELVKIYCIIVMQNQKSVIKFIMSNDTKRGLFMQRDNDENTHFCLIPNFGFYFHNLQHKNNWNVDPDVVNDKFHSWRYASSKTDQNPKPTGMFISLVLNFYISIIWHNHSYRKKYIDNYLKLYLSQSLRIVKALVGVIVDRTGVIDHWNQWIEDKAREKFNFYIQWC